MQINSQNQTADFNSQPNKFAEKGTNPNAKSKEANIPQEAEKQQTAAVVKNLPETTNSPVGNNTNLNFSRDDKTNQIVVELVDNNTGETVRQVPTEVSLKLAAIFAQTQGNLIDKEF